ncbi:hypothetical protein THAOC_27774, partial [Thalassiosira oceanica]
LLRFVEFDTLGVGDDDLAGLGAISRRADFKRPASSGRDRHSSPQGIVSTTAEDGQTGSRIMMMQPRDSKRARPLQDPTLLEALDSDLLLRCASYLDADGLARLGRASAAFGTPQAGRQRSLANEAARQRFRRSATDEERRCLPKHNDEVRHWSVPSTGAVEGAS